MTARVLQPALIAAETVLILALWAAAASAFADSIPTGLAACAIAAAVTRLVYQTGVFKRTTCK